MNVDTDTDDVTPDVSCEFELQIPAYLQGEMDKDGADEIREHLTRCPACRDREAAFRTVLQRMQTVPAQKPVRDLAPDIVAKIPASEWTRGQTSETLYVVFPMLVKAAAVIICIGGIGFLMLRSRGPARPSGGPDPVVASKPEAVAPPSGVTVVAKGEAVGKALEWLVSSQAADGSWDTATWGAKSEYTAGITALSLLALMKADPAALEGPQAATIRRGIDYLLAQQGPQGRIGPDCSGMMYNHGIGTLALLEAYAQKPGEGSKAAIAKALGFTCRLQNESDSWGYVQAGGNQLNTSATVWQLEALMRADQLGFPALKPRIRRGVAWLKGVVDTEGRAGYSRAGDFTYGFETLTAAGATCLIKAGGEGEEQGRGKMLPLVRQTAAAPGGKIDYYRWYFLREALATGQDAPSSELIRNLQGILLAQQQHAGELTGTWDTSDQWSAAGGRVYTTAMAVLTLK